MKPRKTFQAPGMELVFFGKVPAGEKLEVAGKATGLSIIDFSLFAFAHSYEVTSCYDWRSHSDMVQYIMDKLRINLSLTATSPTFRRGGN